jgi:prolyl-tRNA synthetase
MLWSQTFIPTLKETPQEAESASHKLMLRAGLIRMLMAGVYSYLPLGLRVLGNITKVIRQEMDAAGASELLLPALQPQELWVRSGRDRAMGEVMIRFVDRRGRKVCLGPTHEEVITDLVRTHVSSYKQLPLVFYQIQTKFRDEIRPRFGVVRACEFIMKDAYSFDKDQDGLQKNYQVMHHAYRNIFARCGLQVLTIEADPGVMGGKVSHEFMVRAASGEDIVQVGQDKINAIEIGHIFQLGTKYSDALSAQFLDAEGKLKPIIMGCYGIGVSRLMAAIIEQNYDDSGIIWPKEISPYQAIVVPLNVDEAEIMEQAMSLYAQLQAAGIETLLDDRDERAGVKFKDAELIGIPVLIVIGQKSLQDKKVEIKMRRNKKEAVFVDRGDAVTRVTEMLSGQEVQP